MIKSVRTYNVNCTLRLALPFLKREGVRRNALRVQRPTSPHLEDKRKHRMARPLRSRSRKALG